MEIPFNKNKTHSHLILALSLSLFFPFFISASSSNLLFSLHPFFAAHIQHILHSIHTHTSGLYSSYQRMCAFMNFHGSEFDNDCYNNTFAAAVVVCTNEFMQKRDIQTVYRCMLVYSCISVFSVSLSACEWLQDLWCWTVFLFRMVYQTYQTTTLNTFFLTSSEQNTHTRRRVVCIFKTHIAWYFAHLMYVYGVLR